MIVSLLTAPEPEEARRAFYDKLQTPTDVGAGSSPREVAEAGQQSLLVNLLHPVRGAAGVGFFRAYREDLKGFAIGLRGGRGPGPRDLAPPRRLGMGPRERALVVLCALALGCRPPWTEPAGSASTRPGASGMRTDTSADFLVVPEYAYSEPYDFAVAETPPTVDFGKVDLSALGEGEPFGSWGEVTRGPDEAFYFNVGNHKGQGGASAWLVRYDPATREHRVLLDSRRTCGWGQDGFGDGKIHGIPTVAPDGEVWQLTFFGPYPRKSDWGTRYFGSWLIRMNVAGGEAECLGHPVFDDSFPIHAWDWERHRLYAVGEYGCYQDADSGDEPSCDATHSRWDYGKVLVYDTARRAVTFAGVPRDGDEEIHWWRRGLLLDRDTGRVYGVDATTLAFVRYDPATQVFSRMGARLPGPLNSWPGRKDRDGAFYVFDQGGHFSRFFPEEDRVEVLGPNWREGRWIENMELSPDGRHLYFVADSTQGQEVGLPLVQYDTLTRRKKVIAFLSDFYLEHHRFGIRAVYGLALSEDGSSVFIVANGREADDRSEAGYGEIGMIEIHIPTAERGAAG